MSNNIAYYMDYFKSSIELSDLIGLMHNYTGQENHNGISLTDHEAAVLLAKEFNCL